MKAILAKIELIPALLFTLIGGLLFFGIDAFCGHKASVIGVVIGHQYMPQIITYTTSPNGSVTTAIQLPQYYLVVNGPHGKVTIVTEPYAYSTPVGGQIAYTESRGLITGMLYSL